MGLFYKAFLGIYFWDKKMIVRSRAPVRISFAGGGTDVEPFCSERGGCAINAAINKYIYSTLETREDSEINLASADYLKTLKFRSKEEMQYNSELDLLKAVIKKMSPRSAGINIFVRSEVPPNSGLGSSGMKAEGRTSMPRYSAE